MQSAPEGNQKDGETKTAPIDQREAKGAARKSLWLWVASLGLVIAIVAAVWFFSSQRATRSLLHQPPAQPVVVDPSKSSNPADTRARLYIPGYASIIIAVDEASLNDLVAALAARQDRMAEMIQTGKAFKVENNTRVRVVETGFGKTRVEILEGEHAAKQGWALEGWIK